MDEDQLLTTTNWLLIGALPAATISDDEALFQLEDWFTAPENA
jgi:hypothetical protein